MSLEKKLGLSFVGILAVVFCGVLALRLTQNTEEPPIQVNIGATHVAPGEPENTAPAPSLPQDRRVAQLPPSPGEAPFSAAADTVSPAPTRFAPPALAAGNAPAIPPPPPVFAPDAVPPSGVGPIADAGRNETQSAAQTGDRYAGTPAASGSPFSIPPPAAMSGQMTTPMTTNSTTAGATPAGGNPLRSTPAASNVAPASPSFSPAQPSVAAAQPPFAVPNLPGTESTVRGSTPLNVAPPSSPLTAVAPPAFVTPPPSAGNANVNPAGAVSTAMPADAAPYVFAPGDSFWSVSQKVYGDGAYYRALYAFNGDRYPHAEDVRTGSVIDVPSAAELRRRFPELINAGAPAQAGVLTGGAATPTASAKYVVQEGDTLFEIARSRLGKAARWVEIYNLNRDSLGENLQNLRPGLELTLPAGDASGSR